MSALAPWYASIGALRRAYRERTLSPVEVVESLLARIDRFDKILNSHATVLADDVLAQARTAEREIVRGAPLGALHGIPISIKDNIETAGIRTAAGSRTMAGNIPARDASCVSRLRRAGALITGKTNLFEFAFGEAHEDYGHVRNPWNTDLSTAGSSTGSVAAVAAGLCSASIGSDTGGSIRVPAAMCGVVGLKPTFERVPRRGLILVSPSLCHVGPIGRSVEDTARVFDVLAGTNSSAAIERGLDGVTLAVAAPQTDERIDPEVRLACEEAFELLRRQGAAVHEVALPDQRIARAVLWAIASAEAADLHRERLGHSSGDYNPVVRRRLEAGAAIPAHAYVRAQRVRLWLVRQVESALSGAAALLLPVTPITAYPLGVQHVSVAGREEAVGQAVTRYTPLASVTGRPAVSVPCGFSADRLPIAFQVVGHPGDEATVLQVARAYERSTDWQAVHPPLEGEGEGEGEMQSR